LEPYIAIAKDEVQTERYEIGLKKHLGGIRRALWWIRASIFEHDARMELASRRDIVAVQIECQRPARTENHSLREILPLEVPGYRHKSSIIRKLGRECTVQVGHLPAAESEIQDHVRHPYLEVK
jgi:hypothetical protein